MGWLHAWVGFVSGLLLFCVFASGSLAVFDTELTRWLQPEIPPQAALFSPQALDGTIPIVHKLLEDGEKPFITLPSSRDPFIRVQYHDGYEFLSIPCNPQTGTQIYARATAGGSFFYNLHYTMRAGRYGETMITLAGLALLVTLGSGLIIHIRRLIPGLLIFRPFATRLRAWLDAHILASVPFLPFLIMITYTGTFIRARTVFPPISYSSALEDLFRPAPAHDPSRPKKHSVPARLPSLPPLLAKAEEILGKGQTGLVLFRPESILFIRTDMSGPLLTGEHIDFSPVNGNFLRHVLLPGSITHVQQLMAGIHYARWAGPGLRWMYFLSGLAGTIMLASGSVIFLTKRRQHSGKRMIFRLAEGLTIGCIPGFLIATLSFFWANRLLGQSLSGRVEAESHIFFIIWGTNTVIGLISCLCHHPLRGWKIQFSILALLGLFLTPLDFLTRPGASPFHTPTVFAATDFCFLLLGLASLQMARKL